MIRYILLLFLCLGFGSILWPSAVQAQLHHANRDLPCVNKNYNLLLHVAVDSTLRRPLRSEVQLDTMVQRLNEFFEPICVSFSICEINILEDDFSLGRIDLEPITQADQLEELKVRFSLRRRINIFFLDYISGSRCGASTFESILTELDANIYVENECNESLAGQVAHHLGHTFGLRNTYDPATIELVDGSNCDATGDRLCDTPADPFGQALTEEQEAAAEAGELVAGFVGGDCEFIYEVRDPNGDWYQPDVGNIMSAYPCKCGFTQEQYRLMVETILKSEIRHF